MAAQSIPLPPTNSGGKAPRWTQPVSFYGQSVFSKYYAHSICAFLMLVPFLVMPVEGQAGQVPIGSGACTNVTNFDANFDYFKTRIQVDDAALFTVEYKNNYKVLMNKAQNLTYVLTECGTPVPEANLFPSSAVFVYVPVSNVASLATTAIPYIEMLGKRSTLKVVDTESLVTSPCVQYGLNQTGAGGIIGLEDKNLTLRAEQLNSVDVIFSAIGPDFLVNGTESKTISTSEASDPGPLNRAEWLEFYSTFFNLEEFAQSLTATINNNYRCFKTAANAKTTKPIIAWASYVAPAEWNNNTASWSLSGAEYKKILSTDAGASFFNGTTSSFFSTAAEFAEAVKDVDVLVDETFVGESIDDFYKNYNLTPASTLKFVQNKAIFREDGLVNPNDGRDWLSSAVVMDDAVLQDIIRAVHPDALPSDVNYNWIRNVAKNEPQQVLTAANCTNTDSNAPISDRAIQCSSMKVGGGDSAGSKIAATALTAVLGLLAVALAL
ncbi:hypothetical protein BGZ76_008091 [Entomortierella beljakovae]|nr:hypothetical protein BGZ76_008091 [Entomortierella beljakovae]